MWTNGVGAVLTAIVAVVFAVTKFTEGAWIIIIVVPALVSVFFAIHRHYRELAVELSLDDYGAPPRVRRHRVILPISGVHRGTVEALRYANSLSDDITAVLRVRRRGEAARVQQQVGALGQRRAAGDPRLALSAAAGAAARLHQEDRGPAPAQRDASRSSVPQFVPRKWWHQLLHAQTAVLLRLALVNYSGIVITNVPYRLGNGRPATSP